ncbi:hypothetical protein [Thiothrix fructosivorans]|uniref:Arc-like DNA binding domain-containing protein n=1 Tax=Thiothrix fructosivorans TaxID=111770 RepID=A0A8B0SL19_9GAMM|nr:hypothetical protein [Thiothrix fructosivorans]MBO0612972.1 hypothetical protein [Thiothrix fructosivorans]QTX11579.1 hypothetical protein J1836_004290 [Thiothrix fructosivorans]
MKQEPRQPASYPLRLETETRAKLEALAKANGRSLNAQIVLMLDGLLQSDSEQTTPDGLVAERIKEYVRQEMAEQQAKLESMAESIKCEFAELSALHNRVARDLEELNKSSK